MRYKEKFSLEQRGRTFQAKELHAAMVSGSMPEAFPRSPPTAEPRLLSPGPDPAPAALPLLPAHLPLAAP